MQKEIFISVERYETRVAIKEDNELVEVHIEREISRGSVGNIYKGRVSKILPGIQSAFVDVGLEKDTFLHVSDIIATHKTYPQFLVPGNRSFRTSRTPDSARIEDFLRVGQEIMVQVAKEQVDQKGARVTTRIALPGRYFVYMPGTGIVGISRRIPDREERVRLRRIVMQNRQPSDGFITRTASENATDEELRRDMEDLIAAWESIKENAKGTPPPALIHTDVDPVLKTLRDHFGSDVTRIVVDSPRSHGEIKNYLQRMDVRWKGELVQHQARLPLFDAYGIEEEIQKSIEPRVWLPSGGHLVINQTEALVAIDVNTGRFVGSKNLEDTVFRFNMQAVHEVVRQIRLRDLGGILIIDFIDMENEKNRRKVMQAFRDELRKDRAQSKILQISEFGLIEMTRKRSRTNIQRMLCKTCPYCDGAGRIKSEYTLSLDIRRRVLRLAEGVNGERIVIKGHPDVLETIKAQTGLVDELENTTQRFILLQPDATYHHEQFDIYAAREDGSPSLRG